MRIALRNVALATGLMFAAGCAGQQVATDYSPAVGFGQYKAFAVVAMPDSASHQLLDDRVRHAVEEQLGDKGLTATNRSSADLYVGYGVVDHSRKEVTGVNSGWGWGGWGWRYARWGVAWPVTTQRSIRTYTDGTVVVNLVDAKTKRVVWHGEATDVVTLPIGNTNDATRRINDAVAKMFQNYPPQQTGE